MCHSTKQIKTHAWTHASSLVVSKQENMREQSSAPPNQMGGGESDSMQPVWRVLPCCITAKWHRRSFVSLFIRCLEPRETLLQKGRLIFSLTIREWLKNRHQTGLIKNRRSLHECVTPLILQKWTPPPPPPPFPHAQSTLLSSTWRTEAYWTLRRTKRQQARAQFQNRACDQSCSAALQPHLQQRGAAAPIIRGTLSVAFKARGGTVPAKGQQAYRNTMLTPPPPPPHPPCRGTGGGLLRQLCCSWEGTQIQFCENIVHTCHPLPFLLHRLTFLLIQ